MNIWEIYTHFTVIFVACTIFVSAFNESKGRWVFVIISALSLVAMFSFAVASLAIMLIKGA